LMSSIRRHDSDSTIQEIASLEGESRKTFVIRKEKFVLDERYVPIKKLGRGAYGMVISAKDMHSNGNKVAIKKNKDVFYNTTNAKRILREIVLLKAFNHPNIIALRDILNPISMQGFEDVYLVLEYMQSDLHKIIYSDNKLSEDHIAYMTYQILCGLKYMHSAKVYHRDLKPGNILVNADCHVRICDMGLARGVSDISEELTEYVVTRWYRAPEVVLSASHYSEALDVWSVGCILAELYNRKPLFRGEDYSDQLRAIFSIIGSPSEEEIAKCITSNSALKFVRRVGTKTAVPWNIAVPRASVKGLDLLSKILVLDPSKRITVDEALRHPYFEKFYDHEFVNTHCVAGFTADTRFELEADTKESLKRLFFKEIRSFRPNSELEIPKGLAVNRERSHLQGFFSFFSKLRS